MAEYRHTVLYEQRREMASDTITCRIRGFLKDNLKDNEEVEELKVAV
jgi:hypothetical protein